MTDTPQKITVAEIEAMEAEKKRVTRNISLIGREIYSIRHGESSPLSDSFRFSSYRLTAFDGTHYCGMDEVDWEIGTPLVCVSYYNSRWEEGRDITFPQAWLTDDWKRLETERVTAIREAERVEEKERRRQAKIAHEKSERRTFERLKEKFA